LGVMQEVPVQIENSVKNNYFCNEKMRIE